MTIKEITEIIIKQKLKVHQVQQEQLVHKVQQVHRRFMVYKVQSVLMEHEVHKAIQVQTKYYQQTCIITQGM